MLSLCSTSTSQSSQPMMVTWAALTSFHMTYHCWMMSQTDKGIPPLEYEAVKAHINQPLESQVIRLLKAIIVPTYWAS